MRPTVWAIGHSTRPIGEFLNILAAHDIELVADVRRFPGSRRVPQFTRPSLESSLHARGIDYVWLESLGGRRRSNPESRNTGWRHSAFRAYADHVETDEFADGLFELAMLATGLRTAIMCAEILWWRCHRRIIADVLTWIGFDVVHVRDAHTASVHRLAPPARIVRRHLTYAAPRRAGR